jgi:hypothetical protein
MEKNILGKSHTGVNFTAVGPHEQTGLIYKKYAAAMKNAEELLNKTDSLTKGIYECLNCGKLTRLVKYIKNGSVVILLMVSYSEVVLH